MKHKLYPLAYIEDNLGLSRRRLQVLCRQGRIPGARFVGRIWMIPGNFTVKPGTRGPKLRG